MDWNIVIGKELQAISNWLDTHPEVLDWLEVDLQPFAVTCKNIVFFYRLNHGSASPFQTLISWRTYLLCVRHCIFHFLTRAQ